MYTSASSLIFLDLTKNLSFPASKGNQNLEKGKEKYVRIIL
jgi:hypothetical protein